MQYCSCKRNHEICFNNSFRQSERILVQRMAR